jgi:hypothetical protein
VVDAAEAEINGGALNGLLLGSENQYPRKIVSPRGGRKGGYAFYTFIFFQIKPKQAVTSKNCLRAGELFGTLMVLIPIT